jgi:hypothetical protein
LPAQQNNALYTLYRPVRNRAQRYDLFPSLVALWAYSLHIIDGQTLSWQWARGAPLGAQLKGMLYPFQMSTLAREIILNAQLEGGGDQDLSTWNGLAELANEIRRADERMARTAAKDRTTQDIMWELHRQSHHQFPMQQPLTLGTFVRAFKIFGQPAVDALLIRRIGMTMMQLLRLGFALQANFLRRHDMNALTDYTEFGIPLDTSRRFFEEMAADVLALRHRMKARQSYDREWLVTFNELAQTPLIRVDPMHPERLLCPVPRLLFDRVTNGVFFDLVKMPGFSDAFGPAFQVYVGEVLQKACTAPGFLVSKEQPYQPLKARLKHGTDWILSDATGHVFIECKTKRFAFAAKMLTDADALDRDLRTFATAIVQHYKNIIDAKNGLTSWNDDGLPVYPLLVTLDDLYLFGSAVREGLDQHVRTGMMTAGIPLKLLDDMPWQIASVRELEMVAQVINQRNIGEILGPMCQPQFREWSLETFVRQEFITELAAASNLLFPDDLDRLFPWEGISRVWE